MAKPRRKSDGSRKAAKRPASRKASTFPNVQELSLEFRWELEFRQAAESDDYAKLGDHLDSVGLYSGEPERLLDGTVEVIKLLASSYDDPQDLALFLDMQCYDTAFATQAKYAFTFDWNGGCIFARVLVTGHDSVDPIQGKVFLANPWGPLDLACVYDYTMRGAGEYWIEHFDQFCISRVDGKKLTKRERAELQSEILADFTSDYGSSADISIDTAGKIDKQVLWTFIESDLE